MGLVLNRKPRFHAAVFATEGKSCGQTQEWCPRLNRDILSQNPNELESKEMSGKTLNTRLDIKKTLYLIGIQVHQVLRHDIFRAGKSY